MDLHGALTISGIGGLVAKIKNILGGVWHVGAVLRTIIVCPELDVASVQVGAGHDSLHVGIDIQIDDILLEGRPETKHRKADLAGIA